ncbi:MAG: polysaccharide deacetylase family protein [Rhodocyclaceae bacterium]|nr:polysaccharide deacetylase family protein [Rhodocyclaceae bacterium]
MTSTSRLQTCLSAPKEHHTLRLLLSAVSTLWSWAADRRLAIVVFHRVRPRRDALFPGEPDRPQFAAIMEMLAHCFNCLPLDEAVERLSANRSLPNRAVAITFDDGYADNYTEAVPILQHNGLTATFFIASGFVDGGCMWNDEAVETLRAFPGAEIDLRPLGLGVSPFRNAEERVAVVTAVNRFLKYQTPAVRRESLDRLRDITGSGPRPRLMLTSEQVRRMHSAGMGIGGHTVNHPILGCIDDEAARREIGEDRERLAGIIGAAPSLFAYPNGKPGQDYRQSHVDMVRAAGYRGAVTTVWGAGGRGDDVFQLPRFSPWDRQPVRFALRLAYNYTRSRFRLA